ncbi:cytochrome P450 [Sphaerisporangium rufum]|uniref:Cytochrome P450 n=1 Tax=Sphaerisporangium rufum TaxID=1381558 RepID=A0A919R9Q2_9ACTN|nr:cytochrome P450 [Sphaerisporangium rufum]GII81016.1 cytochrome P450 [Sphaerisporangium rufum]
MAEIDFDPFDPAHRADPYPYYRRLREVAPVWRSPRGAWVLTRYRDCTEVLRDARFGHGSRQRLLDKSNWRRPAPSHAMPFILLDPPEHTRQRSLVNKAFTPRRVQRLAPWIGRLIDTMLDEAVDRGEVDLVEAFAHPLPATVISELLGVPGPDRELVRGWSRLIARGVDPDYQQSPEEKRERDAALASMDGYFRELVAERRARPGDDLLSELIAARDAGSALTDGELLATCTMIYVAGHETTTDLLANGTLALIRNPGELKRLRDDPALVESAVEEFLRYDPPTQLTRRTVLADVTLGGHPVARGEQVVLVRGAANRDPDVFDDPERLDVGRAPNRHIAFDGGVHFCLGAGLARLEARLAFQALVTRAAELALVSEEVPYKNNLTIRGPRELRVRLAAG